MPSSWLPVLLLLAMSLFAANSLLCRIALTQTATDPVSFAAVRMAAGALALWLIAHRRRPAVSCGGSWASALALLLYAILFSCAYVVLSAATGALLLFCAVQLTMVLLGIRSGERPTLRQGLGALLSMAGLAVLLLPQAAMPSLLGAMMMIAAGIAWAIYSHEGRASADAIGLTAGNFGRATLMALVVVLPMLPRLRIDGAGAAYAVASGAIASGAGYALWYALLPRLRAISAATVQLSVPVIAAIGGVAVLAEPITRDLVVSSIVVLIGIGVVATGRRPPAVAERIGDGGAEQAGRSGSRRHDNQAHTSEG